MTPSSNDSLTTDALVTMTVLRDGYWEGRYAHEGDVIHAPAALVDTLQLNGFAMRQEPVAAPVEARRRTKGSTHGG
jgi:hypothetical protein